MEQIPQLGFGTYQVSKQDIKYVIPQALKSGYTHLDCAYLYRNQKVIGEVLKNEDFKNMRSKLWITSKVDLFSIADNKVEDCLAETFKDLQLDYLDLVLLHAPSTKENNLKAWMILERYQRQGKIKKIGVSNFKEADLKSLQEESKIIPYLNQIEVTPFCTRENLVKYCVDNNIIVSAHSPLTKGHKLNHETIIEMAKKYEVTPAQIMLQWSKQKYYVVLPRSKQADHIKENINCSFKLSLEDMELLDKLNENYVTHPKYL